MGRVSVGLGATCRARCVHKWGDAQVQFTGVSGVRADGRSARQRHARHADSDTPHAPGEDGVRELRDVPWSRVLQPAWALSPCLRGLRLFWKPSFRWKIPSYWGKRFERTPMEMTRSARAAREPSSGKGVGKGAGSRPSPGWWSSRPDGRPPRKKSSVPKVSPLFTRKSASRRRPRISCPPRPSPLRISGPTRPW